MRTTSRDAGERPPDAAAEAAPSPRLAYFSMEVAIDERLPIYSGGLGVLAADTLRSLADLRLPAVGVSLLYARGYFRQTLDGSGNQREAPVEWDPMAVVRPLPARVGVTIGNRSVLLRACQYDVKGTTNCATAPRRK
jgi:starch phosphorylase